MVTTFLELKNDAYSKLAAALTNVGTNLEVTAGEGANFPTSYPFHLTCEGEIVSVTASPSTDNFTIVRAQQGTSAAAHAIGITIDLNITAKSVSDLNTAVNTIEDSYIHKDGSVAFTGTQSFNAPVIMTSSLSVAGATDFGAPVTMSSSLGVAGAAAFGAPATFSSSLGVAGTTSLNVTLIYSSLGVAGAVTLGQSLALQDDQFITFGGVASLGWETADADVNLLVLALPDGGAVDSPTLMIGDQSVLNFDLGTIIDLAALNEPNIIVVDADADSYLSFGYHSDDTPHIHTNRTFRLEVSGDTDDYFKFLTDTGVPTIFATGSYLRIGDVKFTQHSLDAEDDLMVSGKFEVSGVSFFDEPVTISPIAAADSHLIISGTAKLNTDKQALYINFPSETVAANAIWVSLKSTVTSGDLTGIRSRVYANAASNGANVRGGYFEAKMGAVSKYAAMLEGALIHADYSAGSATISGDVRGLTVHISQGTGLSAANLYGILLSIQTRGNESIGTDDVGLLIRNEAVGGNGRTMGAAIKITDLNMGGGISGFTYDIIFQGGATLVDDGTELILAGSTLKVGGIASSENESLWRSLDSGVLILRGGTVASGHGAKFFLTGITHSQTGAFRVFTPNAAGDADTVRLIFSGKAATALVTWSACTHTGLVLSGALDVAGQYLSLTERAAPGAGAANTVRVYAFEGAGDALTDLCAVFQDGSIDVFAQETTPLDAPIFTYPSKTEAKLLLRKEHSGLVKMVAVFPNGKEFTLKHIEYHDPEKIAANIGAESPLPDGWLVEDAEQRAARLEVEEAERLVKIRELEEVAL